MKKFEILRYLKRFSLLIFHGGIIVIFSSSRY